jgi:uncharacterized RDD family membrane protein YckC
MNKVNTNRVIAFIIDLFLFSIFASIFSCFLFEKNDLLNILIAKINLRVFAYYLFVFIYFILFDIVNTGETIGKSAMSVKTFNLNDSKLTLKQRLIRSCVKFLSIILIPISIVIYYLNGYTIHDNICKTKTS